MENFKSNLSSNLEFRLEYCWLPVPGRRENFTGLLICIICRNLSNNANGHFTLATLPLNLGRNRLRTNPWILKTPNRWRTGLVIGWASRTFLTCVDQRS